MSALLRRPTNLRTVAAEIAVAVGLEAQCAEVAPKTKCREGSRVAPPTAAGHFRAFTPIIR